MFVLQSSKLSCRCLSQQLVSLLQTALFTSFPFAPVQAEKEEINMKIVKLEEHCSERDWTNLENSDSLLTNRLRTCPIVSGANSSTFKASCSPVNMFSNDILALNPDDRWLMLTHLLKARWYWSSDYFLLHRHFSWSQQHAALYWLDAGFH